MTRMTMDTWEDRKTPRRRGKKAEVAVIDGSVNAVTVVSKLGAARNALAQAEKVPDITKLIDHAEAVRAAAKSLHVSTAGINAWMRFVVDAERKGWAHIEAMRKAGELATRGQTISPKKKGRPTNMVDLNELIGRRSTQRASEWAALSKLTEHQLNEIERVANEEDRLLSRAELLRLAKAGKTPRASSAREPVSFSTAKEQEPSQRPENEIQLIAKAREIASETGYLGTNIMIDDDAAIDRSEEGFWIAAWVWVEDELSKSDLEHD